MHWSKRAKALVAAAAVSLPVALAAPAGATPAGDDEPVPSAPGGEAMEGVVEVNGARIFYEMKGEGQPVVLIHGYPLSGELFRDNVDALAQEHQVITLDLRGYGRSEAPGDEPSASVGTYGEDVLAVMDELGVDSAIIGGMSMGGPIAFSMYEQAPERFDGLVLIDTIAAAATPPEAGTWQGTAELVREQGIAALPPLVIDEMLTGRTRMERPELADFLIGIMNQASQEAGIAGAEALATRPDFTPLLDDIDVPTLILVGLEDSIYPFEISQEMQSMIAGSELVILEGAAHAANLEAAEQANQAILDWAAGISASAPMPTPADGHTTDDWTSDDGSGSKGPGSEGSGSEGPGAVDSAHPTGTPPRPPVGR